MALSRTYYARNKKRVLKRISSPCGAKKILENGRMFFRRNLPTRRLPNNGGGGRGRAVGFPARSPWPSVRRMVRAQPHVLPPRPGPGANRAPILFETDESAGS